MYVTHKYSSLSHCSNLVVVKHPLAEAQDEVFPDGPPLQPCVTPDAEGFGGVGTSADVWIFARSVWGTDPFFSLLQ